MRELVIIILVGYVWFLRLSYLILYLMFWLCIAAFFAFIIGIIIATIGVTIYYFKFWSIPIFLIGVFIMMGLMDESY